MPHFFRMGHSPRRLKVPPATINVPGNRKFPLALDLQCQIRALARLWENLGRWFAGVWRLRSRTGSGMPPVLGAYR
jgi:hypothetical protein